MHSQTMATLCTSAQVVFLFPSHIKGRSTISLSLFDPHSSITFTYLQNTQNTQNTKASFQSSNKLEKKIMADTSTNSSVVGVSDSSPNENPGVCPPSSTQCAQVVSPSTEDAEHADCKKPTDSSSDSIAEEEGVLVDASEASDAEHLSDCESSVDSCADSLAEEEGVLVDPSEDSDSEHPDCKNPTDPSPHSFPQSWPDLDKLVLVDPPADSDSDSDEILFTNPRPVATDSSNRTAEQLRVRPPLQQELCKSRFCGVVGIRHTVGPYLHRDAFPLKNPRELGLSSPPWNQANPPQQVWDAWIESFPTGVGPERENTKPRTEKYQREVDLVDGFIAHHSWIPDETLFHPASMVVYKRWCESWKQQREEGNLRPKVKEVRW